MKAALLLTVLTAAACVLPACGGGSETPVADWLQANTCSTDADCSGTIVDCEPGAHDCEMTGACDVELSACVDRGLFGRSVILRVTDPQSSATFSSVLEASEAGSPEPSSVRLPAPVLLRGMVDDEREGTAPFPIPARITFRRASDIPGLTGDVVYAEAAGEATREGDDEPFNFRVRLHPGRYEVEVEPTGEPPGQGAEQTYYPLRLTHSVEEDDLTRHLELRYESESRYVFGTVTSYDGEPLGGVRVYAHESESGQRISNIALTACSDEDRESCGRFRLAVPPGTETFRIRIEGDEASPFLPRVDRGGYNFEQRDANGDGIVSREELGEVRFPAFAEPVVVRAVVLGENRAGARSPVVGAVVTFRSDQIGEPHSPVGSFEARATTDEDGAVVGDGGLGLASGPGVRLLPLPYVVTITPPANSGHASVVTALEVEGGADPQEVTLAVGHLQHIRGRVRARDGTPLSGVRVEAVGEHGRAFSAVNGVGGDFLLEVDPGRYDLTFVTPEGSNLPWVGVRGVAAFDDAEVSVVALYGVPVRGTVSAGADGQPVSAASVEAFVERDPDTEARTLVPVGRATTGESGAFTLLVAPGFE